MPADSRLAFQHVQAQMTDWLRDPANKPAPAVEPRRLTIYRELFFNNVRDFVENAYPVLKSLLPEEEWTALISDFFAGHRCQSPYFRDISLEFRTWMEAERSEFIAIKPWVQELLHYEWVELAAECAEIENAGVRANPDGDLLEEAAVVGECVWPLVYRWPVHVLAPDNPPAGIPPELPTCLIVYRDDEDVVRFLEVNALTARLVELLQMSTLRPGRAVLEQLASEAGYTDAAAFLPAGAEILLDLRAQGIVQGSQPC